MVHNPAIYFFIYFFFIKFITQLMPTILEKAWARHISAIAKPDGRYVPKTVDSKGDNVEVVVFD